MVIGWWRTRVEGMEENRVGGGWMDGRVLDVIMKTWYRIPI